MKNVLLHIGATMPSAEDVTAFRPLVDALGARLHVIYTHADPLSAGGQTEMPTSGMPEMHQAMEAEAREKLADVFGHDADAAVIQIRSGDVIRAIVDYTNATQIDLIVVGLASEGDAETSLARAVLDATTCSLLVWRSR